MRQVIVEEFGGPEVLKLVELDTPVPGPGEVLVRLTCIGMNHADLMMRAGEYKLASGDPPFTPGIEGGGVVEAVGAAVDEGLVGKRVILGATTRPNSGPRPFQPGQSDGGTYRSHYLCYANSVHLVPEGVPEELTGALWLAYLTAWGCLAWQQDLQPGQHVLLTAASSPVAWAGAQIARSRGAIPLGLTRQPSKAKAILAQPQQPYETVVCSQNEDGTPRSWTNDIRRLAPRGMTCIFDPVAAGAHMDGLIKVLGMKGTIWIYGLLGQKGPVDLFPLIRKWGAIRGWLLGQIVEEGPLEQAMEEILQRVGEGQWSLPIAGSFPLDAVQDAHYQLDKSGHLGKFILLP